MNRHSALSAFLIILFIFASCISVNAAENATTRPDIIIKISRLNQAINAIDKMAAADMDQPTSAPSFFFRSLLFGTDWIDPDRPIVIGIDFKNMAPGAKPKMAALIPYTRQNEDFHISYNAVSKIDHYIVSLPPDEGNVVSDQMAYDLARASLKKPDGMLSMELAASQLLNKADSQIQKMLLELDSKLDDQTTPANNLTPEDINKLLKNLINTAKQLEMFSVGIDITDADLIIFSDALALQGTDLSKLFTRSAASKTSHMGKYTPKHHINFKSASYDFKGMLTFFNTMFGEFYKKIGIDLADIENMASYFTGEMAGGMSFNGSSPNMDMDIEMIAVLNKTEKTGAEFLETVYLPWMLDYGQNIASFYNQHTPGEKVKNIFSTTSESKVLDHKVFGVECEIPVMMPDIAPKNTIKFHFRTTAVGNLLLTASSDERLEQLIQIAGTLEKQPYDGPLMKMDIDLGAYLDAIRKMIPETASGMDFNFPDLGSLAYTLDMEKGKLSNKYIIKIDDIRSMVSAFKQAAASMVAENESGYGEEQSFSQSAPTILQHSLKGPKPKPKKEDTAEFWLDKGLLYATYGNDREAIKFYKKALHIDPNNSRSLFNIGLSYSSLGNYDMAISTLNRALSLAPDNGDYHYGLGWIYLLKGEPAKAMEYIRTAADLGNPDARKYLIKNQ